MAITLKICESAIDIIGIPSKDWVLYLLRCRGVAQLVARVFWEHEVARSNRVAPTTGQTFPNSPVKQVLVSCRALSRVCHHVTHAQY